MIKFLQDRRMLSFTLRRENLTPHKQFAL